MADSAWAVQMTTTLKLINIALTQIPVSTLPLHLEKSQPVFLFTEDVQNPIPHTAVFWSLYISQLSFIFGRRSKTLPLPILGFQLGLFNKKQINKQKQKQINRRKTRNSINLCNAHHGEETKTNSMAASNSR